MIRSYSSKFQTKTVITLFAIFLVSSIAFGQTDERGKNNPYSPSPGGRGNDFPSVIVAQRTLKRTKNAETLVKPLTEIYKVGVGDILFVDLKNSALGSRYCTVRQEGTIDFPLAGEDIIVAGQTVDEIAELLASGITLFPDPRLEVKVREYASHKITVSGMVDNPGDKSLRREAIPLYVIRSESVISTKATKVIIKRAKLIKLEVYDLHGPETDVVLIYPGDTVEFTARKSN